jgi:hypothetical protein
MRSSCQDPDFDTTNDPRRRFDLLSISVTITNENISISNRNLHK